MINLTALRPSEWDQLKTDLAEISKQKEFLKSLHIHLKEADEDDREQIYMLAARSENAHAWDRIPTEFVAETLVGVHKRIVEAFVRGLASPRRQPILQALEHRNEPPVKEKSRPTRRFERGRNDQSSKAGVGAQGKQMVKVRPTSSSLQDLSAGISAVSLLEEKPKQGDITATSQKPKRFRELHAISAGEMQARARALRDAKAREEKLRGAAAHLTGVKFEGTREQTLLGSASPIATSPESKHSDK